MLFSIIIWFLLCIFLYLTGVTILKLLGAEYLKRIGDRFIISVWLGIIIYSNLFLALSIFLPLSPIIGAVAIILSAFSTLWKPVRLEIISLYQTLSKRKALSISVLAIFLSSIMTQEITWIDTGLYHFGSIRWLSEYGAVPGVALIHERLGFTSSWFALAAPLNFDFFDGSRTGSLLNGFIYFIFIIHFSTSIYYVAYGKTRQSDYFIIALSVVTIPLFLFTSMFKLMSEMLVSTSPDIPIIFLVMVVGWSILNIEDDQDRGVNFKNGIADSEADIIALILSTGAVSIKITALPLMFVAYLFYVFNKGFKPRRAMTGIGIICLILTPLFIFGIVTSGCPLYPQRFMCLDLPWSITHPGQVLGWSSNSNSNAISTLWIWIKESGKNQIMLLLNVYTIGASLLLFKILDIKKSNNQMWLLLIGILGLTFLMIKGPSLRFGFGFGTLAPCLLAAKFLQERVDKIRQSKFLSTFYISSRRNIRFASTLLISMVILNSLIGGVTDSKIFLPPKLSTPQVVMRQVNDVTYFLPVNHSALCWDAELPCTFKTDLDVRLRDPSRGIKAGFIYNE